jgi:hypothetical protein
MSASESSLSGRIIAAQRWGESWLLLAWLSIETIGRSRGQLYALWREDKGPRRFTVGNKVLIAVEDAAEWRRQSVAATPKYDESAAEWRRARPAFSREAV